MVSLHCFNSHFPEDTRCVASFHLLISHLHIFSGEVTVKVFGQLLIRWFIFLLWNSKSSLYILDNSPSSSVSFAYIFLPIRGLSSNSLDNVFCRVEILNFNEV